MSDLSTSEQRARAGVDGKGRMIRRGPPKDPDRVRVDGVDYPVVGEEERVDPAWERQNTDGRREEWAGERRLMTDAMRRAREQQPLVPRLTGALSRLHRITNLRARPIASAGSTSEDAPGGRRPPGSAGQDFDRYVRVIGAAIDSLEQALDVEEGIAPGRSASLMTTAEKDRELFTTFAGVLAEEVSEIRPEQGHKRTVYKRRKAAGLDARGLDPDTGIAPTPARVNAAVVELNREGRRIAA